MTESIAHLISEAVVVRICHDLASPSGALTNGVELLGMALGDEGFQSEAIGLLKNSTVALSARLEFYRAAFGNANAKGLTAAGARAVAEKFIGQLGDSARIYSLKSFPDNSSAVVECNAEWWRFALLMVLVAAESMPFGGDIAVDVEQELPVLHVKGRQVVLPDQFFQELDELPQIDPRTLGSVLLRYRAEQAEMNAIGESQGDAFRVSLVKKYL